MVNSETQSLFHYTKSIDSLKSILKNGLEINFCEEKIGSLFIGIPMISFCDIPLSRTAELRSSYNSSYAIGFSKYEFLKTEFLNTVLNPVQYIVSKSLEDKYLEFEDIVDADFEDITPDWDGVVKIFRNTLKDMSDKYKRSMLLGFIKSYYNEERQRFNYTEREWRVIMPEMKTKDFHVNWFWDKGKYDIWRGDKAFDKPKPDFGNILSFNPWQITHIIVENESQVIEFVDFLSSTKINIGGLESAYPQRQLLISKITSFERIESDF